MYSLTDCVLWQVILAILWVIESLLLFGYGIRFLWRDCMDELDGQIRERRGRNC